MKTSTLRFLSGATAGLCLVAGVAWGTCAGDENAVADWIFEPVGLCPGWALNAGTDKDVGNLGLTGGAEFSTNVPPVNCDCGHSLLLPGTNGVAGAVSIYDYDPLAGAEKFSILAWVRRDSADGANLSARIFSDTDSTSLTNTTSGVEFRFSGNAGNLALRINGTEVSGTVGGIAPTNGEWHHVAVVYDGTRAATNYATRNVHFYVDGIQRGVGSVLQSAVAATNYAPVVVGNASPSRTAANLLAGNVDNVMLFPGWAPEPAGNGNANAAIQCFMEGIDDIFPPYISAPADVEAEAGECLAPVSVALGTPTVGDDCMVAAVTNDAPETFPPGTNVVTWTVFDEAGNSSNSVQIVTVVPSRTGDCDEDGLTDYEEIVTHGTDWNCADSDGDGLSDGDEVALETFPLLPDSDGDGWTDGEEVLDAETDPLDPLSAPRLARGVLLHAVKYSADADSQWIQLHCNGPREVDVSGFRLQVAGTNWETQVTFPSNTWMVPGHFLLIGGTNVPDADIEADLNLPGSYSSLPTAGIRLVAPENSTNAPVDVLMYGSHVPFNEQGLDTAGWLSETTNLWASSTRHLERWEFGRDTDREGNWHHVADGTEIENSETVLDTDGDGLTDEQEYTGARNDGVPTDPLNLDSDGDGLWDGFEIRNGLDPQATHSGGSATGDYDTVNPSTGNTFGQDQLAAGVEVSWSASKSDWTMGGSIGSNGWVHFSITASDGDAIWASIAEGGHTPEDFTYSVENASILHEYTRSIGGFSRLCLLLQPTQSRGICTLSIQDNSEGSGVTDPNQIGADISAAFQAARLNISMPHTDESTEESPGEFLVDHTVHRWLPRTELQVAPCELDGFPGKLLLTWDSTVQVYSSRDGSTPLSQYQVQACGYGGTTLYVEGVALGHATIQWKSVESPSFSDEIGCTVFSVRITSPEEGTTHLVGEKMLFASEIQPLGLSNVSCEWTVASGTCSPMNGTGQNFETLLQTAKEVCLTLEVTVGGTVAGVSRCIAPLRPQVVSLGWLNDYALTKFPGGQILDPVWVQPLGGSVIKNDPGVYVKAGTALAELDIRAPQGLSHPVQVEVKGVGTDVNFGPSSAIFDDWDWSSGKIQLQSSTLRNNVNVYDTLSLDWQYRVKQRDGSWSAWINMNQSDHVLYTVDSQPAASPLYDLGVDKACRYANGASDFVGAINSGVAAELRYAMAETSHDLAIFNLGGGQCCCQAGVFCQLVSHVTSSTPVVVYGWAGCAPDKQCVYFWNNQYASFQCQRPANDSVETNPHFLFHAVAQHNGTIYDSSYGVVGWPTILEMAPSIPGKHPNRDSFQTGPSLPFSSIVDWTCPH